MGSLKLNKNKILKLTNVLIKRFNGNELDIVQVEVEKMVNYLKSKGSIQVGPAIQYANTFINQEGQLDIEMRMLLQSNNYIKKIEEPYYMESIIRVKNCMYVRYQGGEDELKYAYDKIILTAFEEDIPLKGDSYTIFVDQQDDQIIADVFMERADNE